MLSDKRLAGNLGLVNFTTPQEIDEAAQQRYDEQKAVERERAIDSLAAYVRKCFQEAESHKSSYVTPLLLKCRRQRDGEYEPDKLELIRGSGGNETYFNITRTKCEAAQSWLTDVMLPPSGKAWELSPTPLPELPQAISDWVKAQAVAYFQTRPFAAKMEVQEYTKYLYNKILDRINEEAAARAEKAEQRIYDIIQESNYNDAFRDFLHNLCVYKAAFFKGPIVRNRKVRAWRNGIPVQVVEPRLEFDAPSPFDIFPSPGSCSVSDGYLCQLVNFSPLDLSAMRDVQGWSRKEIDAVLDEHGQGVNFMLDVMGDSEIATANLKDDPSFRKGMIRGIEFWGPVQGKLLDEWGLKPQDPNEFYECTVVLIGNHAVRAVFNPDVLDNRPFFKVCFEDLPDSFWGTALPEKMRDCQDLCNATARNMLDNFAFCSGPMAAVDVDALADEVDPTRLFARMVLQFHGSSTNGQLPITFFQPDSHSRELLDVYSLFAQEADDRTSIPRYAHGNENVGGAGQTASGLSMLMNSAAKGIKRLISSVDAKMLRPSLEAIYAWLITYTDDQSIRGDIRVVPKGALAALVREQTQLRQAEFLAQSLNPIDSEIIGIRGRAHLLREYVKNTLQMNPDKILPDDQTLEERMAAAEAMAMGAPPGQPGQPQQPQGKPQPSQNPRPAPPRPPVAREPVRQNVNVY